MEVIASRNIRIEAALREAEERTIARNPESAEGHDAARFTELARHRRKRGVFR